MAPSTRLQVLATCFRVLVGSAQYLPTPALLRGAGDRPNHQTQGPTGPTHIGEPTHQTEKSFIFLLISSPLATGSNLTLLFISRSTSLSINHRAIIDGSIIGLHFAVQSTFQIHEQALRSQTTPSIATGYRFKTMAGRGNSKKRRMSSPTSSTTNAPARSKQRSKKNRTHDVIDLAKSDEGTSPSTSDRDDVDLRIELIKLHQASDGVKPNWQKYQNTSNSLSNLVQFRALSMGNLSPHSPDFHFQRTACSYSSWIKTISSLAPDFLGPSTNEQWYCPDVIDLPLLARFANPDGSLQPHQFISPLVKTPHPESTLVRFLFRLQNPPASSVSDWAKIIAASVELMADNLYKPPPPETAEDDDETIQGVQVLQYLEKLKNSSSTFDTSNEDTSGSQSQVIERSHSVDVLHDFRNLIIDVFMAYSSSSVTTTQNTTSELTQLKEHSNQGTSNYPITTELSAFGLLLTRWGPWASSLPPETTDCLLSPNA
ncbi:hypothetical protein PGT21_034063 [Puccinia graminis f. sp. tritici]|uniref:Uncharacterized protein n=1 Tax=Puccinia graminis f. sp. tritici TaxID=56615 RepID=A0A5B0NHZ5_PUCGR|nr:hypothetical protein PGT21_034063 [Puccinia graminis f. sp. tritici]